MKYTSAQANKLLIQLQEDRDELLNMENQSRTFIAATTEDLETARPVYSYEQTRERLDEIERKIRQIKHSISRFNLTHEVEDFGMTADQLLVYIPQLKQKKSKLGRMARRLPKTRQAPSNRSNIIEYEYANYDIEQVKTDYLAACDELTRAQLALETLNTTETMEIDI